MTSTITEIRRRSPGVFSRAVASLFAPIRLETVLEEWEALGDEPSEPDLDLFAVGLLYTWMSLDAPLRVLPREQWVAMFRAVGFLDNGLRRPDQCPERPLTLYRGARPGAERGLSWSPKRKRALQYVEHRKAERGAAELYRIRARPEWILGTAVHRHGVEYIVEVPAIGLVETITPASTEETRSR